MKYFADFSCHHGANCCMMGQMTPEAQQEAIAQTLGWKKVNRPGAMSGWDNYQWQFGEDISTWGSPIPNFIFSLNAMYDAIQFICKKKHLRCYCNSGLDGSWECVLTESETPNCIPCDGDFYGSGDSLLKAMIEAFIRSVGKLD